MTRLHWIFVSCNALQVYLTHENFYYFPLEGHSLAVPFTAKMLLKLHNETVNESMVDQTGQGGGCAARMASLLPWQPAAAAAAAACSKETGRLFHSPDLRCLGLCQVALLLPSVDCWNSLGDRKIPTCSVPAERHVFWHITLSLGVWQKYDNDTQGKSHMDGLVQDISTGVTAVLHKAINIKFSYHLGTNKAFQFLNNCMYIRS